MTVVDTKFRFQTSGQMARIVGQKIGDLREIGYRADQAKNLNGFRRLQSVDIVYEHHDSPAELTELLAKVSVQGTKRRIRNCGDSIFDSLRDGSDER